MDPIDCESTFTDEYTQDSTSSSHIVSNDIEETKLSHMNEIGVWYFAIGSMTNPISLANRNLFPLQSFPAVILDHSLRFFGRLGMAEAYPEEGKTFHGVLHLMTQKEMIELDILESAYSRKKCRVKLYNGTIREGTVYCRSNTTFYEAHNPPSQRYIELLIAGCEHFGVDKSHIDYLKTIPYVPRKKPEEWRKIVVPDGLPYFSEEELSAGDGTNGHPILCAINGKVRQYIGTPEFPLHPIFSTRMGGKHLELFASKALYDSKYGVPERLEDVTREHAAYLEDFHLEYEHVFITVGLIDQKYRD